MRNRRSEKGGTRRAKSGATNRHRAGGATFRPPSARAPSAAVHAVPYSRARPSAHRNVDCAPLRKHIGWNRLIETNHKATSAGENAIGNHEGAAPAWKWVYDDGIDRPVMMEAPDVADVDGDSNTTELKRFYYHGQLIGSVTHLTDESQAVRESYAYDPYGKVTIKDASGATVGSTQVGNPWMYTGRQWDHEAELYHYRARAYSPELRRFIQRDPLEYVDGMNAGAYVRGRAVAASDEFGLDGRVVYYDQGANADADKANANRAIDEADFLTEDEKKDLKDKVGGDHESGSGKRKAYTMLDIVCDYEETAPGSGTFRLTYSIGRRNVTVFPRPDKWKTVGCGGGARLVPADPALRQLWEHEKEHINRGRQAAKEKTNEAKPVDGEDAAAKEAKKGTKDVNDRVNKWCGGTDGGTKPDGTKK